MNLFENCHGICDGFRSLNGRVTDGMINITVEGRPICEEEIDYFDTDYGTDFSNQTYINNTFSNTTNFQYNQSSSEKCTKDINRLFESVVVDATPESFESKERFERIETRFYREPFLIGLSPSGKRSECEGNKCMVMEEKRFAKNGKYEQSLMFSGGRQINTLHSKLNNEENNTSIQLGVMSQYRHWRTGNLISDTDEKIDLEIKPKNEEDGYNLKLSYNNDRVFDGWFYFTSLIRRYAREQLPAMLERQMGSFGDTLMHLRNQDYQTALSWLL